MEYEARLIDAADLGFDLQHPHHDCHWLALTERLDDLLATADKVLLC